MRNVSRTGPSPSKSSSTRSRAPRPRRTCNKNLCIPPGHRPPVPSPHVSVYTDFEENRIKHLEMIQAVISRLGTNSFLVKGLAVTVSGAFLGFAVSGKEWGLALAGLLPVMMFWYLPSLRARQLDSRALPSAHSAPRCPPRGTAHPRGRTEPATDARCRPDANASRARRRCGPTRARDRHRATATSQGAAAHPHRRVVRQRQGRYPPDLPRHDPRRGRTPFWQGFAQRPKWRGPDVGRTRGHTRFRLWAWGGRPGG
jgi:hypothetical protein